MSPGEALALAVDVGGTKLAAAVVDDTGNVLVTHQVPTPTGSDPEEVFEALAAAIDAVLMKAQEHSAARYAGMGLATAAPLDLQNGSVSPVNIPAWRNFPLRERLAERYAIDVRMLGDAAAVAVGEHWRGAARGRANVLGMVVSTGVGGGIILDGRVVLGTTGNAGHIGHMSVDPYGPDCACGGRGCLEAIASGTSIARWAEQHGAPSVTAAELAGLARSGDAVALATFRRAGEAIGMAVAGVVTLLDLDVVVIGGGVARAGSLLFNPIADAYARYAALGYAAAPRVVRARLGGEAGLIGAAAVVLAGASYWDR